jgi:hypothetical protein
MMTLCDLCNMHTRWGYIDRMDSLVAAMFVGRESLRIVNAAGSVVGSACRLFKDLRATLTGHHIRQCQVGPHLHHRQDDRELALEEVSRYQ